MLDIETLDRALLKQSHSGLPIGEELVGRGIIRPFDFYQTLAEQNQRRFVNLRREPPDRLLLHADDIEFYLHHRCLPWRRHDGTLAIVAVDPRKSYDALKEKIRAPFLLYQTSSRDILWAVCAAFSNDLTHKAQNCLRVRNKDASADQLFSRRQGVTFCVCLFALVLLLYFFTKASFLALNGIAACTFMALAALRFVSMGILRDGRTAAPVPQTGRADSALPIYTILIPLLREASVLPILANALQKLDYPASKLDIKLILEENDDETIRAAKELQLPGCFELIIVPLSLPMTKPKACNFALPFARGEFLVVFDAEDIPGAGQLREAVDAFDRGGPGMACTQAPLAYYNWNENWLTRHFAIEYAAIFDLLLPTLAHFRLPFPLGGTSTHFRTEALRTIGAWDPFNVTEDADLGIRLHEAGYQTGVLKTSTLEEANCRLPSWVRQRSRWLKGWMQTYIVRMRHPLTSLRQLGVAGFLIFQIVIGAFIFSALVHPLFYVAIAYSLTISDWHFENAALVVLLFFNISVLFLGFSSAILAGVAGAYARDLTGLGAHVLTMPAYWLLISFSAYRALWQLVSDPHSWEKTEHGLSAMVPDHLARARYTVTRRDTSVS